MKFQRVIALTLAAALALCGCSASKKEEYAPPPVETPFYEEEALPVMGDIYITSENPNLVGVLDWETLNSVKTAYSEATIRVDWEDGDLEEQDIEIKVRGNSSAEVAKKSYTIKFAERINFMDMGEGKKWTLLANPFDKSLMRIGLAFEYAEALGMPFVSQYRFCRLWMNDKYMGIYVAVEPIGDGKDRVDLKVKQGDAIFECDLNRYEEGNTYITAYPDIRMQVNEPDPVTRKDVQNYESFFYSVYKAVSTRDYTVYSEIIDIDSFVDFYIFNEVVKDIDFGEFSTRYYIRDGKLYAGPVWDMDLSMGNVSQIYDEPKYFRYHNSNGYATGSGDSTDGLWVLGNYYGMLMEDAYFRDRVYERWQEMLPVTQNLYESNELGDSLMDRYLAAYEEDFLSNYDREQAGWPVGIQEGTYADQSVALDYDGNVEELRGWLTKRVAWLDTQFGAIE